MAETYAGKPLVGEPQFSLPPELTLAAACSRWPPSTSVDAAVVCAAQLPIDWERFTKIVARNRIAGLAHAALTRARVDPGTEIAARLGEESNATAVNALALARASVKLQRDFDQAGLTALIVKGAPLAVVAYGELGIKDTRDVDLLVRSQDAIPARRLLTELGYRIAAPQGLSETGFERWAAYNKEACFRHVQTGVEVDLHWRLVENKFLLSDTDVAGRTQIVPIGAGIVRTLADSSLFAYLCVHGSVHNWARLKWLADLNAFVSARGPEQIETHYAEACRTGAGRAARLALFLSWKLLGLQLTTEMQQHIHRDKMMGVLAKNALATMQWRGGIREHLPNTVPWARALVGSFLIGEGANYLREQASILWNSSDDRARIRLPRRLAFLYHALRVPLWGKRLITRAFR